MLKDNSLTIYLFIFPDNFITELTVIVSVSVEQR